MVNKERIILSDEELALVTGGTGSTGGNNSRIKACDKRLTKEDCLNPYYNGAVCGWNGTECVLKPIQVER